jgi:hypothetical protein
MGGDYKTVPHTIDNRPCFGTGCGNTCDCGGQLKPKLVGTTLIYTPVRLVEAHVADMVCATCHATYSWDGYDWAILR